MPELRNPDAQAPAEDEPELGLVQRGVEAQGPRTVRARLLGVVPLLGSLQGYIGLALVLLYGTFSEGTTFWNHTNLTDAIGAFGSRGILAVGETLVILTAGIDLSVGSMLGLCSMVSALLLVDHNLNPYTIMALTMGVGLVLGLINGLATTKLKIQAFVATLATLSIYRGIDRVLSNNVAVATQIINGRGQLSPNSDAFQSFGTPGHNVLTGLGGGIYFPVLAFVVICIIFQLLLSRTKFGRHIYAVGGNETAARLSGINVTGVKIAVFALCGLLAGVAGPIDAVYSASADPLAGTSFELDAIAAAVIGGASLFGGKGTITGTLVGALILTLLDNILGLNNVSDNTQLIIKGVIVLIAVVLQRPGFFRPVIDTVKRLRPGAAQDEREVH